MVLFGGGGSRLLFRIETAWVISLSLGTLVIEDRFGIKRAAMIELLMKLHWTR